MSENWWLIAEVCEPSLAFWDRKAEGAIWCLLGRWDSGARLAIQRQKLWTEMKEGRVRHMQAVWTYNQDVESFVRAPVWSWTSMRTSIPRILSICNACWAFCPGSTLEWWNGRIAKKENNRWKVLMRSWNKFKQLLGSFGTHNQVWRTSRISEITTYHNWNPHFNWSGMLGLWSPLEFQLTGSLTDVISRYFQDKFPFSFLICLGSRIWTWKPSEESAKLKISKSSCPKQLRMLGTVFSTERLVVSGEFQAFGVDIQRRNPHTHNNSFHM